MEAFFWSDTHFNHTGILHMRPPHASCESMNADLVARWNSAVLSEQDTVWFLGDFGFEAAAPSHTLHAVFHALRGRKNLVTGNHDGHATRALPWRSVVDGYTVLTHFDGRAIRPGVVLCHYPMESWPDQDEGSVHLHGHRHGFAEQRARRFDVGADVEAAPLSLSALVTRVCGP